LETSGSPAPSAGAARRREPKVEALATDREQVRHHAGDGLGRGVAVVGRLDESSRTRPTTHCRRTPARRRRQGRSGAPIP
jgi:hypothetical protein